MGDSSDLRFTSYPTRDLGPTSTAFLGTSSAQRCGIYVLHFENGERYVGKAIDVVTRVGTHRRHNPDLVSFDFAVCPRGDLDKWEQAIVQREERAHPLRNINLTGRPGGDSVKVVYSPAGQMIALPWERAARQTLRHEGAPLSTDRKVAQYQRLRSRPDYPPLRRLLGRYIHETIADPERTTGLLWFLTAMPGTGRGTGREALFTLSCGNVETLYAFSTGPHNDDLVLRINVAGRDATGVPFRLSTRRKDLFVDAPDYRPATVTSIAAAGIQAAEKALEQTAVLEAAYQLNTELMRKGSRMFARYHNPELARDVIAAASEVANAGIR